ncbi:ATP-binding cassette, subfamily B, MsbA [Neolewinella xylanilytica]|uniref:ATP-binding cassette, subfamily B, MsbA n=1 Tax=Neolewinella xylanilytica TaxID=1514080 RepID=A0A2S6I8Z0_9BACT|nr:ABC transporter ATP-binding protein [Neolewinella xylanilytica]PPK87955.1 ATP-binding cassette, subfamily B, MsbA [Neolewinella xylanilytica]
MSKVVKKLSEVRFLSYFRFFYSYLGSAVFIALGLSMLVALLDGIGLTMFLPLLHAVDGGTGEADGENMGSMRIVLDGMNELGLSPTLVTVLLVLLFFFFMKGIAKFALDYYRTILNQRFANIMRLGNMKLLAGLDYSEFSKAESGKIQNTFSGEIVRINTAYRSYFQMLQYLIMTGVYVALAYVANPKFAVIVAVGGLLSNLAFSRIYRITKEASRRVTKEMNNFQGFLIESVSSFKFLKATDLITRYKEKIDQSIVSVEKQQRTIGVMNGIANSIREPLVMVVVVAAILIQVTVFQESLGLIILSLLFFYRGLTSLGTMQNSYNQFLGVSGSIENMEAFTEEMKHFQEDPGTVPFSGFKKKIEVKNLNYGYDDVPVLKDMSFVINKYETIGIVGESGAGKTTLVNLLCGLLPPPTATILVDGIDLRELNKHDFRRQVGYVTQESQVFTDTVANNVSFFENPSEETELKIQQALKLAHAAEFVAMLPEGLNTQIGINGVNLSGGQRQRISIARELYREVDILILDEATSALDSQSEKLIQENIDSLAGTVTMIVIAHRLSTISKADKIVFLRADHTYEIGTFESLQKRSANFRQMVSLQTV